MADKKQVPLPRALARVLKTQLDQAARYADRADSLRDHVADAVDEHCRMSGIDPSLVQYDPRAQVLIVSEPDDKPEEVPDAEQFDATDG